MNTLQRLLANRPKSFVHEFNVIARMHDMSRLKAFLKLADHEHGGIVGKDSILKLVLHKTEPCYLVKPHAICLNKPLTDMPYRVFPRDHLREVMSKLNLPLVYFCPSRQYNLVSCLWLHSNVLVIRSEHLYNDFWHTKVKLNGLEDQS